MSNVIPIKPNHLPQFVGYAEVEAALGVSRRTVERMVREDKFPRPVQLTPNRVGWKVETVCGIRRKADSESEASRTSVR